MDKIVNHAQNLNKMKNQDLLNVDQLNSQLRHDLIAQIENIIDENTIEHHNELNILLI